jgi:hypothetical protein
MLSEKVIESYTEVIEKEIEKASSVEFWIECREILATRRDIDNN